MSGYTKTKKTGCLAGWVLNISLIGTVVSILMLLVLPESEINLPTSEEIPFYKNYKIMIYIYMGLIYFSTTIFLKLFKEIWVASINILFAIGLLIMSMFSGKLFYISLIMALINIVVAFMFFAESYNDYKNKKLAQKRAEKAREQGRRRQHHHRHHHHHHHHHHSSETNN